MPYKTKEEKAAADKRYYERVLKGTELHRIRSLEATKRYYRKHTKQVNARTKKHRKEHPRETWRMYAFHTAKARAKKKGREFTIKQADIPLPDICPVFGVPLLYDRPGKRGPRPFAASIDRVDATKGYTLDNIQVISHRANSIKRDATAKELRQVADWMDSCSR